MKKLWFKRKRYGWGWTPITWQGWLILLTYVGIIAYIFLTVDKMSHSTSDFLFSIAIYFLVLTGILVCICYLTGEKPKWQSGEDKEK